MRFQHLSQKVIDEALHLVFREPRNVATMNTRSVPVRSCPSWATALLLEDDPPPRSKGPIGVAAKESCLGPKPNQSGKRSRRVGKALGVARQPDVLICQHDRCAAPLPG